MNPNIKRFVGDVTAELLQNKINLEFSHAKVLKDDYGKSRGYFDEENRTLKIATNYPQSNWVGLLAHEFCHFRQSQEKSPEWLKSIEVEKDIVLWDWLKDGKKYPKPLLTKCIKTTQKVEWDCEKRTVELIKEYNLPINIQDYIRAANCYVLFFNVVKKYRKWYRKSPNYFEVVRNLVAPEFIRPSEFDKMPPKFEELVVKNYL